MSNPPAYASFPKPGTYRITSVVKRTIVLEILNYNEDRVAVATWVDKPNQHWILQYSGRGYKIKNRQYGGYLAAPTSKHATIVGAGDTPTVWTLLRTHVGFAVQCGESDQVIDLHTGLSHDGNVVLLWPSDDLPDNRRWIFEWGSEDTGGETPDIIDDEVNRLKHELEEKDAQLRRLTEELAKKNQQLTEQGQTLGTLATALHQVGLGGLIVKKGPQPME